MENSRLIIGNGTQKKESSTLDNALYMTGHGKFHYLLLFSVAVGCIQFMYQLFCTSYLIPAAQCDFHMTSKEKGLLGSIANIGVIASCHLWGFLADTIGRRKVLIISLTFDFIFALGSTFAPDYHSFLILRFLSGFMTSCPSLILYVYLSEFHSEVTRSRAVIMIGGFVAIATVTLPCLAWMIIPQTWSFEITSFSYNSWRIFLLFCAVPDLLVLFLIISFLPESPKYLLDKGEEKKALQVLRYIYSKNTGRDPEEYKVYSIVRDSIPDNNNTVLKDNGMWLKKFVKTMWKQTYPLFKRPHIYQFIINSILFLGIFTSFSTMLVWLPEIFNRMAEYAKRYGDESVTVCEAMKVYTMNSSTVLNMTGNYMGIECDVKVDPKSFMNTLIVGASKCIVTIVAASVVNITGRKPIMILFLCLSFGCGVGFHFVNSQTQVLVLACAFVALCSTSCATLNSYIVDIFPTNLRGMAISLISIFGMVGSVGGSLLMGAFIDNDCYIIIYVICALTLVCTGVTFFLPSLHRRGSKLRTIVTQEDIT